MVFGKLSVFLVLVIALIAIGAYVYVNVNGNVPSSDKTISVQGNSEITSKPDLVSLYVIIETINMSAQVSQSENAEISENVMDALKALRIKDSDIETLSYNTNPEYDWRSSGSTFKGYKTTNNIKISLDDSNTVGAVIDAVAKEGALISTVQFELNKEHENELKAQALEEASRDAKTKAEAIAKGSGGRLGSLVSISTNDYRYMPYMAYAAEAGIGGDATVAKEAATQISERELTVYANVQATYKIR